MIDNDIVELINKEVDGVATAEETSRLKTVLSASPEARLLFDNMRSMTDAMAQMMPVDPPQTLKPAIMRAIGTRISKRKPAAVRLSLVHSFRTLVFGRPGLVFAGGFAAGFLLFFLTTNLLVSRSVDDSELTGTLVLHGFAPGFSRGDLIDINNDAVKGAIETQFGSGLCLLRLHLDAPRGVSVSILTDPALVHLEAIRPSNDSGSQLSVREGEIVLGAAKEGDIVMLFATKGKNPSAAHMELVSSGKTVFTGVLPLEKAN
jgi:hypothetical protein